MVYGFVLDFMHTVGGGAALDAFETLFGLSGVSAAKIRKETMVLVNQYMDAWADNTPYEFGRNVKSFDNRNMWKMREAHQALVYHSIALLALDDLRAEVGEAKAVAFTALVVAVHLIGQTTHESPSAKDMKEADRLFRHYVEVFQEYDGNTFLKYKNHCLIHLGHEAQVYKSHMGGLDAYPFENFLGLFRDTLIKSGKNVLGQCYRALKDNSYHCLPTRDDTYGELEEYDIDNDAVAECMIKTKTMNLPVTTIVEKSVQHGVKLKFVKCIGFKLTRSYPNNIIIARRDANDVSQRPLILAIKDMYTSDVDDVLYLECHEFDHCESAFSKYNKPGSRLRRILPYSCSIFGFFEAKLGMNVATMKIPFKRVIGKMFPFHMNLTKSPDPLKNLSLAASEQHWVLVQFMHTLPVKLLT